MASREVSKGLSDSINRTKAILLALRQGWKHQESWRANLAAAIKNHAVAIAIKSQKSNHSERDDVVGNVNKDVHAFVAEHPKPHNKSKR
jgi:hypothetical protein